MSSAKPAIITDPVRHPAHYEVYPVQPIEITRHLVFCLGNAVKYVLRAPYKGGVEDCDKALQYLEWERETPSGEVRALPASLRACARLTNFLRDTPGDMLWQDVAGAQADFMRALYLYILHGCLSPMCPTLLSDMEAAARDLSRILALRDTTGQIYECLTGLPQVDDDEPGGAHE